MIIKNSEDSKCIIKNAQAPEARSCMLSSTYNYLNNLISGYTHKDNYTMVLERSVSVVQRFLTLESAGRALVGRRSVVVRQVLIDL